MGTDTWECVLATWMTVAGVLAGFAAMGLMLMGLGYFGEDKWDKGHRWWRWGCVLGVVGGVLVLMAMRASSAC